MNIRLFRAIHDHHSAHRKQAIRAWQRKADADDEPTWAEVAAICIAGMLILAIVGAVYFLMR